VKTVAAGTQVGHPGNATCVNELRWRCRLLIGPPNKGLNAMFTLYEPTARSEGTGHCRALAHAEIVLPGWYQVCPVDRLHACSGPSEGNLRRAC